MRPSDEDDDDDDWEPYTTERLSHIPGQYKVLSDVVPTFQLDFNNPQVRLVSGHMCLSLYQERNIGLFG